MRVLLLAALVPAVAGSNPANNGLGRTPPMGWTSWTTAWTQPNQTYMQHTMDRLVTPRAGLSLAGLGYRHVGLDDFWQQCGAGVNGSFHSAAGAPLVNLTRFPSMANMTAYGHARGLAVGWYLNNCGCKETADQWQGRTNLDRHWNGDVRALAQYKFDGAKFDACGIFENLTKWATLINGTGRPMLLENCHWGGDGPYVVDDATGELWCPYNMYRAGADISPGSWSSFLANLASLNGFLTKSSLRPTGPGNWPLSQPGCWAYPDSVQTGQYTRIEEDRTNFGAWAITSSPLILGMDLTNQRALARVWHILTNKVAIAINQQWAGHPGRIVFETHRTLPEQFPRAVACSGSRAQRDWQLGAADPARNDTRFIKSVRTGRCVDAWRHSPLSMEPCTGNASQRFRFNQASGTITAPAFPSNEGELGGCFDISGKHGPDLQLTKCYGSPNDAFTFSQAGVWADRGGAEPFPKRCMEVQNGTVSETQVFAKPQPMGGMAVFAFNAGRLHQAASPPLSLDLHEILMMPKDAEFRVYDVWAEQELPQTVTGSLQLPAIPDHDSVFFLLSKSS